LFNSRVFVATNRTVEKRNLIFEHESLGELIEPAVAKRKRSLQRADELWGKAADGLKQAGMEVFFAADAAGARGYVSERIPTGSLVVKGKSLTTEEIELRQWIEAGGSEVLETDLGEWIIQQRGELPSHLIVPAIHLDAAQVAAMIERRLGKQLERDPEVITGFIRAHLREKFLRADIGITGANFVTADPAMLCMVSNEGNVSLTLRLPKTLFIVVGYDRIYDDTRGLEDVQRLLTASATGQPYTSYLDVVRSPLPHQTVHVVVLDNGRRELLSSELAEAGRCVRCASCLNVCPVYQEVGGHVFGKVYHGGIGSLLTAFTGDRQDASRIASLCLRCSTCEPLCPMQIPISKLVSVASKNLKRQPILDHALKRILSHKPKEAGGRSAVFIGCAFRTPLLRKDTRAIRDAVDRYLTGATVIDDGCCGMPHFTKGLEQDSSERYSKLAEDLRQFDEVHVPCASCYSFLAPRLGERVKLLSITLAKEIGRAPRSGEVCYHSPCHLKQGAGKSEHDALAELIGFAPWNEEDRCCGGGGLYFLEHPRISAQILRRKMTDHDRAATIVTSCPSCLMQLRRKHPSARVVHPLRLLL
jgi:iron-sulfur cluster protein